MTLKHLMEEVENLKDKHEKEISELKKTVNDQETRIKMLESLVTHDKPFDNPNNPRDTKILFISMLRVWKRKS